MHSHTWAGFSTTWRSCLNTDHRSYPQSFWFLGPGGAWEFAFLNSSQSMLLLLVLVTLGKPLLDCSFDCSTVGFGYEASLFFVTNDSWKPSLYCFMLILWPRNLSFIYKARDPEVFLWKISQTIYLFFHGLTSHVFCLLSYLACVPNTTVPTVVTFVTHWCV